MEELKRLEELQKSIEVKIKEMEASDTSKSWTEHEAYMSKVWGERASVNRMIRLIQPYKLSDITEHHGDLMTLKEFKKACNEGWFIDYDGSGTYVKDGQISDISIYPSDVHAGMVRKDFDSVIWFNR